MRQQKQRNTNTNVWKLDFCFKTSRGIECALNVTADEGDRKTRHTTTNQMDRENKSKNLTLCTKLKCMEEGGGRGALCTTRTTHTRPSPPPAPAMKYLQPKGIASPTQYTRVQLAGPSIMQRVPDLGPAPYIDIAARLGIRRKDERRSRSGALLILD